VRTKVLNFPHWEETSAGNWLGQPSISN
jgi:hypothetical protein